MRAVKYIPYLVRYLRWLVFNKLMNKRSSGVRRQEGMLSKFLTSLDSEASKGLYWEDVNKIPGTNLQGGACP
jgi:hypothetical protein